MHPKTEDSIRQVLFQFVGLSLGVPFIESLDRAYVTVDLASGVEVPEQHSEGHCDAFTAASGRNVNKDRIQTIKVSDELCCFESFSCVFALSLSEDMVYQDDGYCIKQGYDYFSEERMQFVAGTDQSCNGWRVAVCMPLVGGGVERGVQIDLVIDVYYDLEDSILIVITLGEVEDGQQANSEADKCYF